jgi:hypothetical protein
MRFQEIDGLAGRVSTCPKEQAFFGARWVIAKSFLHVTEGKWNMMNRICFLVSMSAVLFVATNAFADPMGDLLDQLGKEYEAVKPRSQYSSVRTDYLLEQTALANYYTNRSLGLIYGQNEQMMTKYDDLLAKYDQIIEQNREIIRLLSQIAKKGGIPEQPDKPLGESPDKKAP